jgi:hypothetical protein
MATGRMKTVGVRLRLICSIVGDARRTRSGSPSESRAKQLPLDLIIGLTMT